MRQRLRQAARGVKRCRFQLIQAHGLAGREFANGRHECATAMKAPTRPSDRPPGCLIILLSAGARCFQLKGISAEVIGALLLVAGLIELAASRVRRGTAQFGGAGPGP